MLTHNENQLTSIEKLKMHSTARPTTFINNMPVAESINENPIKAKQRKRSHSPDSEDSEEEKKETPEMKKDTSISMIDDSYDKIIKNLDKEIISQIELIKSLMEQILKEAEDFEKS